MRALLVPIPVGMLEHLAELERRHGWTLLYGDYADSSGAPSRWWCRSVGGCARRRGELVQLPSRTAP